MIVALIAPALWNGYPLIFFDTEDFVNMSFTFDLPAWRTMLYALLVAVGRPFGTLFAVIVLQAVIVAWVLHEFIAAFLPRSRTFALLVIAIVLGTITSVPWVTSQVLADAFAGPPVLGLAVLAFGEHLPRPRQLALMLPVAISASTHTSHVALVTGLLIALALLRALTCRWPTWPRPTLSLTALSVALGVAIVPAVHKWATGEASLYRSGRILQLAAFVQNGLAKRYLDAVCPGGASLKLCAYRDRLPDRADAFLWWAPWNEPFLKSGGWEHMPSEAEAIVVGATLRFPAEAANAALLATANQLRMIRVGDGLDPKRTPDAGGEYYDTAKSRYEQEVEDYITARQQQGAGIDFGPINAIQIPVAVAAQGGLLVLLFLSLRRGDRAAAGLSLLILLALLGNAIICGVGSTPNDRYQNRIVWITPAACVLLGFRLAVLPRATIIERGFGQASASGTLATRWAATEEERT